MFASDSIGPRVEVALAALLGPLSGSLGCAPPASILGSSTGSSAAVGEDAEPGTSRTAPASTRGATDGGSPTSLPCSVDGTGACNNKIDLLFVIDNSGTMGEEQLNLARNFPGLIEQLEQLEDDEGNVVGADVNIMVTTTDFDNPKCHGPWTKPDYVAAKGAPVYTACTERLGRFTGYGDDPRVIEQACLEFCDQRAPAVPRDQFLHFDERGTNVEGGSAADALGCLGPQGIDGCGFEAPLESMSQALNPAACWNDPEGCTDPAWSWVTRPFLRDGAVLAIAIITDEADCSVKDFSVMDQPAFMAVDPVSGSRLPSSAICWNAGVTCTGLDPLTGRYAGCTSANKSAAGEEGVADVDAALQPLSRYVDLLAALRDQGREVIMLGVLGVPEVDAHNPAPPHQPTAGGLDALVYRNWRDPDVPSGGDILPEQWSDGVRAVNKQFEFGVGPGCTRYDRAAASFSGQAIAPVRIREVCESLDTPDDPATEVDETRVRCCVESICDDDFSPAIRCLTGLIQEAVTPVG